MITVEAKKVGTSVIATVKVGIGTGQFTYTVQFADQGSEAAIEAEAQRELRKTLKKFSRLLVHRKRPDTPSSCHFLFHIIRVGLGPSAFLCHFSLPPRSVMCCLAEYSENSGRKPPTIV
jgi:hypothetical protein